MHLATGSGLAQRVLSLCSSTDSTRPLPESSGEGKIRPPSARGLSNMPEVCSPHEMTNAGLFSPPR
eukprot:2725872-Pyramimonas_sp.AAC.1